MQNSILRLLKVSKPGRVKNKTKTQKYFDLLKFFVWCWLELHTLQLSALSFPFKLLIFKDAAVYEYPSINISVCQ